MGLNNDVLVGGRKFHVQTNYSEANKRVVSNVFNEGQVIESNEVPINGDLSTDNIRNRMNEVHQELITELEVLYYIYEKVKTVRHAPSSNKLGLLFLKRNLLDESIDQFKLALEIDPNYHEVYANLGKALMIADSYEKAIDVLKEGAEKVPNFADIQNYLGIAYLHQKNFNEATKHLQKAINLNPNYIGAHYHLGISFLALMTSQNGQPGEEIHQKAMEHLKLAAERMVDRQLPSFKRIMELVSQESYQEAVEEFLKTKPREALAHFTNVENEFYLKFMYGGKGKDDTFIGEYVQKLRDIIEEHPNYADVRNSLGVANLIQCRNLFLKSLEEFRTALKINPNFKKAEKNLKLAENDGKGFLILLRAILK
ncbi:tetratricopeptide repeat protein [candidate division KSB1 bacterium]|nr:tetratricopeptide repeat protein [candidate division KSB1 bacterium]NIX74355.1 tetratricopeptide repeat protein [candidate division KSB1 bacterium]